MPLNRVATRCASRCRIWVKSGPKADVRVESDLAPIADVGRTPRHVAEVPTSDICAAANFSLLDHLVGEREQLLWNRDAKGLRGFEIDDQFEFSRLLYRQISRLFALENLAGINAHLTVYVGKSRSVAHQSTRNDEVADLIHGWERTSRGKRYNPLVDEKRIRLHEQRARSHAAQRIERDIDLGFAACMDDLNPHIKLLRRVERIPHILLSDRIARVDEKADQRCAGNQVSQQPDLLCRKSSSQRGHAGGVAAGTVQACDKAACDWILAGKKDHRDATSGSLCSVRCRRVGSEDGYPESDEVVHHIGDAIIVPLGPAVFNGDIFADPVASFCKSADECLHVCGI